MLTPHIERLERLRSLLDALPDTRIDLGDWAGADQGCGTVFCAVGWASQHPDFQKEGLKLGPTMNSPCGPKFGAAQDWPAVEEFFGLTEGQAEYLFMPYRSHPLNYFDGKDFTRLDADTAATQKDAVLARLDTFIRNVKESEQ